MWLSPAFDIWHLVCVRLSLRRAMRSQWNVPEIKREREESMNMQWIPFFLFGNWFLVVNPPPMHFHCILSQNVNLQLLRSHVELALNHWHLKSPTGAAGLCHKQVPHGAFWTHSTLSRTMWQTLDNSLLHKCSLLEIVQQWSWHWIVAR
jgi:hypothetical protein